MIAMEWRKVPHAAKTWAGGVDPDLIYRAIREMKCRAARIGAGRNLLVCEQFIDEWLLASVKATDAGRDRTSPRSGRSAA